MTNTLHSMFSGPAPGGTEANRGGKRVWAMSFAGQTAGFIAGFFFGRWGGRQSPGGLLSVPPAWVSRSPRRRGRCR